MSRLISVDLYLGRPLRVRGEPFVIDRFEEAGKKVILKAEDGSNAERCLSRAELLTLFTLEEALFEEETEDPELTRQMPPVTLAFLTTPQVVDWYHQMIMVRWTLGVANSSPRSPRFLREYETATAVLTLVREETAVRSDKFWSAKRINDVLRTWRRAGYSLAALRIQIVPARRKRRWSPIYERAKGLVRRVALKKSALSIANVHRTAANLSELNESEE